MAEAGMDQDDRIFGGLSCGSRRLQREVRIQYHGKKVNPANPSQDPDFNRSDEDFVNDAGAILPVLRGYPYNRLTATA